MHDRFSGACGGGSDTSSGTESGGSETSEAASQGETGSGNESSDEVTTLSIYINHSWYGVEKFEGIIPEAITEATGVVLDLLWQLIKVSWVL
mgnify:CR=1 FL=1